MARTRHRSRRPSRSTDRKATAWWGFAQTGFRLGCSSGFPRLEPVYPARRCNDRAAISGMLKMSRRTNEEGLAMVGAWRFELQTSCAQGRRATRLRYAPIEEMLAHAGWRFRRSCPSNSRAFPDCTRCTWACAPGRLGARARSAGARKESNGLSGSPPSGPARSSLGLRSW